MTQDQDYVPLTDQFLELGKRSISLQKFADGRISILIDGMGLGHCSPQFAEAWFPEATDWIRQ